MIEDTIYSDLKDLLEDLIPQLNKLTIQYMTQSGIKSKSDLVKSVGYELTPDGIGLKANNYWFYASQGRRAGTRKVPITALIDYIKRYGITPRAGQTFTQLAFAIQTAIYKQGINPKNYVNKVIDGTSDVTEEMIADGLIEDIADEIVNLMTQTPYAKEV